MIIKLADGKEIPVENHKARMVQKIVLIPAEQRLEAMAEAGYNTFQLKTKDIFLDMLTDSGVNAMSDNQFAALLNADDAYAGSMTFYDFADAVKDVLGYQYVVNHIAEAIAVNLREMVLLRCACDRRCHRGGRFGRCPGYRCR